MLPMKYAFASDVIRDGFLVEKLMIPQESRCEERLILPGFIVVDFEDRLISSRCHRLHAPNVLSLFSSRYDVDMEEILFSVDEANLSFESTSSLTSNIPWGAIHSLNAMAFNLWDQYYDHYQDDNLVKEAVFRSRVRNYPRRNLTNEQALDLNMKRDLQELKISLINFLRSTEIPIYRDIPNVLKIHPLIIQLVIENIATFSPHRSMGDSSRDIDRFSDIGRNFPLFIIYSYQDMNLEERKSILDLLQHQMLLRHNTIEDPYYERFYEELEGQFSNFRWEEFKNTYNSFYLLNLQGNTPIQSLGLWPGVNRSYLLSMNRFSSYNSFYHLGEDFNLSDQFKSRIRNEFGQLSNTSLFNQISTTNASMSSVLRSMFSGSELNLPRDARHQIWWD